MKPPIISIIMPVYNAELYLQEAIDSILNQTFTDFELLIVDDGSIDASTEIIRSFDDPRIVYVRNESNLGIVESLNRGIGLARGKYIARMDADDISLPDRLEKQYAFLENNPDVSLCGAAIQGIGEKKRLSIYPEHDQEIRTELLFNSAFAHPVVMVRKEVFDYYRYSPVRNTAEDYDLWCRCIGEAIGTNLTDVLLLYRYHSTQTSVEKKRKQQQVAEDIRLQYLKKISGEFLPSDAAILGKIARWEFVHYEVYEGLLEKILHLHDGFFDERILKKVFARRYWWMLQSNCNLGAECYREYRKYSKRSWNRVSLKEKGKFILKCFLRWRSL